VKPIVAAILAVLMFPAVAAADTATGGFSGEPPPVQAPVGKAAMQPGLRTAVAPVGAPEAVVKAIAAANKITRKPYKWGGGHGRWWDSGYDCSGAVSYVLYKAGLLDGSRDSTGFMSYGERRRGQWITIYANGGHAYMEIAGLRFDTSGRGEEGPRWRPEWRSGRGFVKRHPVGL